MHSMTDRTIQKHNTVADNDIHSLEDDDSHINNGKNWDTILSKPVKSAFSFFPLFSLNKR